MTVFCTVCGFFPAVMRTWLRILWRTMLRPFGGLNAEAIHPWQRRLQRLRRRQLAVRHQLEMY
jgi:hypothetical protein